MSRRAPCSPTPSVTTPVPAHRGVVLTPRPSGWRAPRTRRPSPRRWHGCRPGTELLERRQRAAAERSGEGGAAGVCDLGAIEVEPLELRQPSRRRRRRTCRRRRRHEGGEALVAERVAAETETLQRGPPPQGRREGHQPRVTDGGVAQRRLLSRGRAPCPRAAARAEAPASPTCVPAI